MVDQTREPAVVTYERLDDERCLTHFVGMQSPNGGWGQAFGGIALSEEHFKDWKASLCALFGVDAIEHIVGRHCFVLRSWAWSNIEGLEVDGKRFTITDFRRKHWPNETQTPLEEKRARILNTISSLGQCIQEDVQRYNKAHEGYVDWSTPPARSHDTSS